MHPITFLVGPAKGIVDDPAKIEVEIQPEQEGAFAVFFDEAMQAAQPRLPNLEPVLASNRIDGGQPARGDTSPPQPFMIQGAIPEFETSNAPPLYDVPVGEVEIDQTTAVKNFEFTPQLKGVVGGEAKASHAPTKAPINAVAQHRIPLVPYSPPKAEQPVSVSLPVPVSPEHGVRLNPNTPETARTDTKAQDRLIVPLLPPEVSAPSKAPLDAQTGQSKVPTQPDLPIEISRKEAKTESIPPRNEQTTRLKAPEAQAPKLAENGAQPVVLDRPLARSGPITPIGDAHIQAAPQRAPEAPNEQDLPVKIKAVVDRPNPESEFDHPKAARADPTPKVPKPEGAAQVRSHAPIVPQPSQRQDPKALVTVVSDPQPAPSAMPSPSVMPTPTVLPTPVPSKPALKPTVTPLINTSTIAVEGLLPGQETIDTGPISELGALGLERVNQSAATITPASAPQITPRAVAQQIAEGFNLNATGATELSLNPEELGRVKVTFTGNDAGMIVTLQSERLETQDLLRRNIDLLMKEFESAGYETLDFAFSGGGADTPQGHEDQADVTDDPLQTSTPDPQPFLPRSHAASGVDIRL